MKLTHSLITLSQCIVLLFLQISCATTVQRYNEFSNPDQIKGITVKTSVQRKLEDRTYDELIILGDSYRTTGNFQLAELHYFTALKKEPESVPAYTGLGEILLHKGDLTKARSAFKKALELDGNHKRVLLALGRISRGQTDYQAALDYFDRALALEIEDSMVLTELAVTYDQMGELTVAEEYYKQICLLSPDQSSSYNNLGFNYLLQEKYKGSESAFAKALNLDPNSKRIMNNLATALIHLEMEEKALKLFEKSIGKAAAYNNLGYIYMTKGEFEKAEKAFQQALQLNPRLYLRAKDNLTYLQKRKSLDDQGTGRVEN